MMNKFKRVFIVVMDSLGIGNDPKAKDYQDEGANTFKNIDTYVNGIDAPYLNKLGMGLLDDYIKITNKDNPIGIVTKAFEKSNGKDTMTGHFEIMGIETTEPFKTFTDTGFPKELIDEIIKQTGHGVIGNISASGTQIIQDLGEEHLKTKDLIVYTSADSVLQVAANEEVIPLQDLYKYCEIIREITLKDEWKVGRIIARPFIGNSKETFKRTKNVGRWSRGIHAELFFHVNNRLCSSFWGVTH